MEHGTLILAVFIILAKFVVAICNRLRIPPVIGLIVLGLISGQTGLDIANSHDSMLEIDAFAEIGVIFLLFLVGLETDIEQIKKMGTNSLLIAISGVFLPLIAGFSLTWGFTHSLDRSIVMGSVLTATSVSISVLTFADLGRLASVEAKTVVTSAIMDDVIAIILLSILLGFVGIGGEGSFHITLVKIVIYFIASIFAGLFLLPPLLKVSKTSKVPNMLTASSVGLVLIFAWAAKNAELASITGAYLCGVFIGRTPYKKTIMLDTEKIGYTLFIPIFFVSIGMHIHLTPEQFKPIFFLFSSLFALIGIISKVIGCGFVAKFAGFDWKRSFVIGSGMVPRGEVALVIVTLASTNGKNILTTMDRASVIVLVLITAIITPFLIKWGIQRTNVQDKEVYHA